MSEYRDKVQKLTLELKNAQDVMASESYMSTSMIIAAITPIVVFLALYFIDFKYLQKEEGGVSVRDVKKIFLVTALISALVWGGIYGYTKYYP
jgi:hypothetical protein